MAIKMKNKKNAKRVIPKTVQQSIPYVEAYENGTFQIAPGVFSKTYEFEDISFKTQSDDGQETIYEHYMQFLNTISPKEDIVFSFINMIENEKAKLERISPILRGDKYDAFRKEINMMLRNKLETTRNNISTRKYITTVTEADSVDEAMKNLANISGNLNNNFRKVTKHGIHELNLARRLELLHNILNSNEKNFWFEHSANGDVSVDFEKMAKQGLTTKDIISPSCLKFNSSNFQIGERYGQVLYLDNIANWMNTNFLSDLSSVNFESIVNIHISSIPQEEAAKMIHNRSVNITGEIMEKQKQALQNNYSPEFIPIDLKHAKEQIDKLQEDITNRDQRLFYMSFSMMHFANSAEELKKQYETIKTLAGKHMCNIRPLSMQQERGFTTALPLGWKKVYTDRLLTTESLGVFLPFDEINQFDDGGVYFGVNAINKSLIVYNRLKGQNYNELIFGASGSGKSFTAKEEMSNIYLTTDSDIIIIDPDAEYSPLAEAYGGSIIRISPGNGVYINPFDLDIDNSYDPDMNPITMKIDFICGLLETMLGAGARLTPTQRSIVDRCVQQIYRPYLAHLAALPPDANGKKRTIDRQECPTMQKLFDSLMSQPQPEAQNLALIMETYATGSFDVFAHRTNVDVDNRLIIYDIKNVGTNLRELALKVCMNDLWTRIMENRRTKDKFTYCYIDEFHLLLSNPSTAEFLKSIWKRARKWHGAPCGITQNCEELLSSPDARAIINNTSFIRMLNLAPADRDILGSILSLTENDLEYVTNVDPGHGLIYTGKRTIPFVDEFPKDTQLYKIMSTKPTED